MPGSQEPPLKRRSFLDWLLDRPAETLAEVSVEAPSDQALRPGDRYEGPAAWFDGPEVGFVRSPYALTPDGRRLAEPLLRLTAVDDGGRGNWHYEVAGPDDYPQRGRVVPLEAHLEGRTEVGA